MKYTRPRCEKICLRVFLTKRVSNQSPRLNRLARKLKFLSLRSKEQITKFLMRLRGCAGPSAPLLLQITEDSFSQSQSSCYMLFYHERLESKMRNLIIMKYNSDRIVICAVSSKHLQCVCRHTKSCPASDSFLYLTT